MLDAWGVEGKTGVVFSGLGERFAIMGANFKFPNAGYPIHTPVEADLALVSDHGIAVDAIESIHVGMPSTSVKTVDNRSMHNICLQDMLAAALVEGGLKLTGSPFPGVLAHPSFVRLRPRVNLVGDSDPDREQQRPRRHRRHHHGVRRNRPAAHRPPQGHSGRGGATWEDLAGEWAETLPGRGVDRLISLAKGMEHVEDVTELLDAFTSDDRAARMVSIHARCICGPTAPRWRACPARPGSAAACTSCAAPGRMPAAAGGG